MCACLESDMNDDMDNRDDLIVGLVFALFLLFCVFIGMGIIATGALE